MGNEIERCAADRGCGGGNDDDDDDDFPDLTAGDGGAGGSAGGLRRGKGKNRNSRETMKVILKNVSLPPASQDEEFRAEQAQRLRISKTRRSKQRRSRRRTGSRHKGDQVKMEEGPWNLLVALSEDLG